MILVSWVMKQCFPDVSGVLSEALSGGGAMLLARRRERFAPRFFPLHFFSRHFFFQRFFLQRFFLQSLLIFGIFLLGGGGLAKAQNAPSSQSQQQPQSQTQRQTQDLQAQGTALASDDRLSPLILSDATEVGNLAPFSYITRDPDSSLAPSDIIRKHIQNVRGDLQTGPLLNLGFDMAPAWIVFAVHNGSSHRAWKLSFGTREEGRLGIARTLRLYEAGSGKMLYDTAPFDKGSKPSLIAGTELPLSITPGTTALYLLFWGPEPGVPGTLALEMRPQDAAPGGSAAAGGGGEIALYLLIALVGFFAAVALVTQTPGYLSFIVYFMGQAMALLWFSDTIMPEYHGGGATLALLSSISIVSGILMARVFIEPGREDLIDNAVMFVLIGTVVLSTLLYMTVVPEDSLIFPVFMYGPSILVLMALVVFSFLHARKGRPGGYAFTASWGVLLCGVLVSVMALAGFAPLNAVTVNAFSLGVFPQAVLLVLACRSKFARDDARRREALRQEKRRIESMARLRQSKDAADQGRLLRVIEREREIMAELREREAQRAEEMRRAKDAADEANRAKSAFLAVVSHEIRTPMTGIMGMVRLLLGTGMSTDQKEYVHTIQDSGDAMLALLNDILDFEKIESGKMDLEIVDFELVRLVQGVVTLMSGHAADKKITLEADIDSGLPALVRGDPTRLRQVLLNLVNNAIKFTSEGGVTIILRHSGKERGENGVYRHGVYFAVQDTGVGIPDEAQKKLFKPFSQADSSVSRKYGGTGLGLAICKRLIQAMGGSIGLDSREGEGSTFHFTVSFDESNAGAVESGGTVGKKAPARSLRVLVVDDNEINRKVILGLVAQEGHKAEAVASGAAALERLKSAVFDLVLMDVEMPGMRGDEATQALRALPDMDKAAIPVVALTGNVGKEDVERFYRAGMNGFMAKPIDPAVLSRTLGNAEKNIFDNPVPIGKARSVAGGASSPEAVRGKSPKSATTATTASGDIMVFDHRFLDGIRKSLDARKIAELLDELLVKMDELVAAIETAIQAGNAAETVARAHEIKGMAGNFGLTGVSAVAAAIEKAARAGQMDQATPHISDLLTVAAQGRTEIKAWMENETGQA